MAQFVDNLMLKGLKGKQVEEVDKSLSAVIGLFCCLHSRDSFLRQYIKDLGNRLLNKNSISNEHEELMIQKLKVENGAQEVGKMSTMMKDMELSVATEADFVTSIGGVNSINGVEFKVSVLTNATWTLSQDPTLVLPTELKGCVDRFTLWYKNKN